MMKNELDQLRTHKYQEREVLHNNYTESSMELKKPNKKDKESKKSVSARNCHSTEPQGRTSSCKSF